MDAMRMVDRNSLSNHSTHRCTDDMCFFNSQMIKNTNCICCHVMQCVGHFHCDGVAHHGFHCHLCGINCDSVVLVRKTAITVVETHHMETSVYEEIEEFFIPSRHLGSEPHDPQEGRIRGISAGVEFNIDA